VKLHDGTWMGDSEGRLVEVFNPRWWRLDRWVRWWLTPMRLRGTITFVDGTRYAYRVRVKLKRTPA